MIPNLKTSTTIIKIMIINVADDDYNDIDNDINNGNSNNSADNNKSSIIVVITIMTIRIEK